MQVAVLENCTIVLSYTMDSRPDSKFTWRILGGYKFTEDRELEAIV
jgi:hypothetical protein